MPCRSPREQEPTPVVPGRKQSLGAAGGTRFLGFQRGRNGRRNSAGSGLEWPGLPMGDSPCPANRQVANNTISRRGEGDHSLWLKSSSLAILAPAARRPLIFVSCREEHWKRLRGLIDTKLREYWSSSPPCWMAKIARFTRRDRDGGSVHVEENSTFSPAPDRRKCS